MSTNQYAYYGLKCEEDDYAYTKQIPDISFFGGKDLTFSCDFYYEKGYSGNLFLQEGGVCLEVKNEYVQWTLKDGTQVKSNVIESPLLEKTWNHVDVVYKENALILYINRLQVDSTTLPTRDVVDTGNYLLGQHYPGYLRNVRIADYAFDEEEVIAQSSQTTIEEEKLLLYVPFDEADAVDKGKYKQAIICRGLARCVSLISALVFEREGFVSVQNTSINPGDVNLPEFSIALRVFLYPQNATDVVLFENQTGSVEVKEGFAAKLQMTTDKAYLTLELGDYSYSEKNIELSYFEWQNICITVKEKQLGCYVNGILVQQIEMPINYNRNSGAKWFLGNSSMEVEKSLRGAMDYFAVYEKALTEEYVRQISEIEPYLYDNSIRSLFLLHGESNQDLLDTGILTYCNTEIKMMEGTVADKPVSSFQFRTNEEFSGNALEAWETDVIIQLCSGAMAAAAGFTMAQQMPACVEQALIQEIATMPEAQKIFMEYDKIADTDVEDLFKKALKKPKLKSVFSTSMIAGGVATGAVSVLTNQKFLEIEIGLGCSIFAIFLTKIIQKIADKTKPKDPPYIPYDIPEIGYAVNLQTVQFCNGSSGSVPLRKNFTEMQSLPEWSVTKRKADAVAYLAQKQTPEIQISFSYLPAKDQSSAVISLTGKSEVFGNFETEKVTCTSAGIYTAKATLNNFNIKESSQMGLHSDCVKWSYNSVAGIDTFCASIGVDVHVIKNTPLAPWSITEEAHYPTVQLLELIAQMQSKAGRKIENATTFTNAFYEYIHVVKPCKFSATDNYAAISDESVSEITFQYEALTNAFLSENCKMGSLDICTMCKYLAALEGMDTQVLGFYGFEFPVDKGKKVEIASCGIWTKEIEAFGETVTNQIVRHYVIGQVAGASIDAIKVYDLILNRKDEKAYIKDISINDYQKKIGGSSDALQLGFIGYNLIESTVVTPLRIIYDADTEMFKKSTRVDFKDYVKTTHYYPDNLACCHRLSYAMIESILLDTFNFLKTEPGFTEEHKNNVLHLLYDAFYADDTFVEEDVDNKVELQAYFETLLQCTKEDLQDEEKCAEAGRLLAAAMHCLNSVQMNLKDGYVNWNASIGDGYDPGEYLIVFEIGGSRYQMDRMGNIEPVANTIPIGIHIQEAEDEQILSNIGMIEEIFGKKYIYIYTSTRSITIGGWPYSIPVVYSSSNEIEFVKAAHRSIDYQIHI